ncbi:MAG TPA: prepilin-type N-terminal cleavage/methylation domain-containing protein [Fimbriimonadaceae bacterium]|nr:prepilin-type N-terminal cleavage/methylation domain-containing protein [Fimbriimonadaceae bacterium]
MKRNHNMKGFTLIEIMIVVLIIGILLAIAVPNFVRARASSRLKAIESNLKQIDSAQTQWAMEQNKATGNAVTQGDLDGTGGSGAKYLTWPTGPVSGTYAVTVVGANATFDGGSKGAMDEPTWDATCASDPSSCGL